MQEFKPTFIVAVPCVFEKVFNVAQSGAAKGAKKKIFDRAAAVAVEYSQKSANGGTPGRRLQAEHTLYGKLVYGKLRGAFGGRLRYALSGGAPLGERLGHFFNGAGLLILEGYGLTETTGGATVNTPSHVEIGSVGRPVPGASVRIASDGEVLLKGGQVFRGYWKNDAATAEVLEGDGWFHTGDVGEVDDEGFVRITGRKKEILVTAGGKNVAPAVLEDRVRAHALVDQCLVVGDGQPFIAALVTLDREAVATWAEQHGKTTKVEDLVDDPDLRSEIEAAVEDANKAVSKAESIRKFHILADEWTEEGGQLTPSLKLKRNVVMRENRNDVAALYA
jgi:long-chain acyl-CoA synthetase